MCSGNSTRLGRLGGKPWTKRLSSRDQRQSQPIRGARKGIDQGPAQPTPRAIEAGSNSDDSELAGIGQDQGCDQGKGDFS